MIIAVDGPAAAGKGTLARKIADRFQLAYLDTGALYRAVALQMLRTGKDADDRGAAAETSMKLDVSLLASNEIRGESVGAYASKIAVQPAVRVNLLDFQRRFATEPASIIPGDYRGAVLDGRDIGTVVCPDADVKIFVTATAEERAKRRFLEMKTQNPSLEYQNVLDDVIARDKRDRQRKAAPMVPAGDAYLLDTTNLDIEAAFDQVFRLVQSHI